MGETDETLKITDASFERKYFACIPHIVDDLGLDSYAYYLYGTLKRLSNREGKCYVTQRTLAKETGISIGSVNKGRQVLIKKGLITTDEESAPDRPWPYNIVIIWCKPQPGKTYYDAWGVPYQNDLTETERKQNAQQSKRRQRREKEQGEGYTAQEWAVIKKHYAYSCLCCGRKEPEIQLSPDHIVPLSQGGTHDISNIQPLCAECNAQKYVKIRDYRMAFQG